MLTVSEYLICALLNGRVYPTVAEIDSEAVRIHRRKLIGGSDTTVRYEQIAQVRESRELLVSNVVMETRGGGFIALSGLSKDGAKQALAAIEAGMSGKTREEKANS